MKILLYLKSKDFSYGGPAYVCRSIKKFFNKYQFSNKIEISIRDDNDFKCLSKREKNLEILKYDLVSIHGIWSFNNSKVAQLCRKFFIPYTICLHGMLDPWSWKKNFFFKIIFYQLFLKKDFTYASSIHCLNKFEYELTKKFLRTNNVFIFENLLDASTYKTNNEESFNRNKAHKPIILYFGRITEKKGLDKFLSQIFNYNKDFLLKIVGPTNTGEDRVYYNRIKKMVKDLKLENKVEFAEPVQKNKKKSEIMNKADFFILPSEAEGDSVALKEAVLHGLPLIITKNCKFHIEINNQIFGYYINNDLSNVKNILNKIIEMKENEYLNLRKNAMKFSEKFKVNEYKIYEFYKIYENIIRSKNNHNIFRVEK